MKELKSERIREKRDFDLLMSIKSCTFATNIGILSVRKESKSSLRCPCSILEDVPIDLRLIAIRIEIAQGGETWAA